MSQLPPSHTPSFRSVPEMWHHRVESTPDAEALFRRREGKWVSMTWREAGDRVQAMANGFLELGVEPESRICLISQTRLEWVLTDLAILCCGGATTTIYPSNTAEECAFIIRDCGAVVVVCDTDEQVQKLLKIREQLPALRRIVTFDGKATDDGFVVTLRDHETRGTTFAEGQPTVYDTTWRAIDATRLATLIYTSGTTGRPKGVMLTHDSWIYEAEALDALRFMSPADKQFLFLPLSHVFAKVMQVVMIRLGIPTAVDGDIDTLMTNLGETQPTWMGAVPRIFEKAYNKIVSSAKEGNSVKYSLFKWALEVGAEVSRERQAGREPRGALRVKYQLADRLVFSTVKQRFGGRLRFFISGGAPLAKEIAAFFHACDILILEGYGLTESSAATCLNRPDDFVFGTVGKPLPGTEVRVANDGEILIKGRGVMKGYYNLPEATADAFTADGWLRTGDIGVLLDSGHLKITDRKKELIITAGGKNIAPAHFQALLKSRCPYVSQVVMHGDRRPFCVALISIREPEVSKWARENNISFADYADLAAKPEVKRLIFGYVEEINRDLPSYETVKNIALLPEDITEANGQMTASLKVKRTVVEARYADTLEAFYRVTPDKM